MAKVAKRGSDFLPAPSFVRRPLVVLLCYRIQQLCVERCCPQKADGHMPPTLPALHVQHSRRSEFHCIGPCISHGGGMRTATPWPVGEFQLRCARRRSGSGCSLKGQSKS